MKTLNQQLPVGVYNHLISENTTLCRIYYIFCIRDIHDRRHLRCTTAVDRSTWLYAYNLNCWDWCRNEWMCSTHERRSRAQTFMSSNQRLVETVRLPDNSLSNETIKSRVLQWTWKSDTRTEIFFQERESPY